MANSNNCKLDLLIVMTSKALAASLLIYTEVRPLSSFVRPIRNSRDEQQQEQEHSLRETIIVKPNIHCHSYLLTVFFLLMHHICALSG